jgi:hypothetical protein
VQGEQFVVDPGTYAYSACPVARDLFRSTAFHSTVRLDGEEQRPLPREEPFRLPEAARRRAERVDLGAASAILTCSHDGYRRLEPGAVHRRTFTLERESGALEILDELVGAGTRLVESFLRLAPGAVVRRVGDMIVIERGAVQLALHVEGADEVDVLEGWVSEVFGAAQFAPAVVARAIRRLPCSLRLSLVPLGVRRAAAAAPDPAGVGV